jgi:trimeric autotransporter adhesin
VCLHITPLLRYCRPPVKLAAELAPVPSVMFREKGTGRPGTATAAGARGGAGPHSSHLAALLDSSYLLGLDCYGSFAALGAGGAGSAPYSSSSSSSSGSSSSDQQLFTQRIAVLPPKGAKDLAVWKRMLAADTAAAAGEANARAIRAALSEAGIISRCAWGLVRAAPTARESVYSAADLEQLVSRAVSAQLQLDSESSSSSSNTSGSSSADDGVSGSAGAGSDSKAAATDTATTGAAAADAEKSSTDDAAANAVPSSAAAAGSSDSATVNSTEPVVAVQAQSGTTAAATDTAAAATAVSDDKSATTTTDTPTAPAVTVKAGLVVSTQAVLTALSMVAEAKAEGQALEPKLRTLHLENDFEKRVMSECVISPQDVGVTFDDVQVCYQ